MKFSHFGLAGLTVAAGMALAAQPALAAGRKGTTELSGSAGMMFWEGDLGLKNPSLKLGGRLGYNLTERLAAEATVDWTPARVESMDNTYLHWIPYHVDLLYHLRDSDRWVPFVMAGAGVAYSNLGRGYGPRDDGLLINYGVGLKHMVSDRLGWRVDLRHVPILHAWEPKDHSDYELSMGFVVRFGSTGYDRGAADDSEADSGVGGGSETEERPSASREPDVSGTAEKAEEKVLEAGKGGADILSSGQRLGTVHFAFDSYRLDPQALQELGRIAQELKASPGTKILVEGHCDSVGTDEYNRALGSRRASAAANALKNSGVEGARLQTRSLGEDRPIESNATSAGRARNRRAEISVP